MTTPETRPRRALSFVTQVAVFDERKSYTGATNGLFDPGAYAMKLIPGVRGGQLFAYLFRRFGYPSIGWDPHKNLANYLLTTPIHDVFLEVIPYLGGDVIDASEDARERDRTKLMFGYLVTKETEHAFYDAMRRSKNYGAWEQLPRFKRIVAALEATIADLQRPVYVRDIPINCYGRVTDDALDALPDAAEPYHAAGYPIPTEFFRDAQRWEQFTDALDVLGGGNFAKGIDQVIALAEQAVQGATGTGGDTSA